MKQQLFLQYKIVAEYWLFPNHLPFFVAFKSGNNLTTRTDQTVHKGHQSLFVCHYSINELRDMINCCEILVIDLVQIYIFEFQLMLKSVSRKKILYMYCVLCQTSACPIILNWQKTFLSLAEKNAPWRSQKTCSMIIIICAMLLISG